MSPLVRKTSNMISMTIADPESDEGNFEFIIEEEKGSLSIRK